MTPKSTRRGTKPYKHNRIFFSSQGRNRYTVKSSTNNYTVSVESRF